MYGRRVLFKCVGVRVCNQQQNNDRNKNVDENKIRGVFSLSLHESHGQSIFFSTHTRDIYILTHTIVQVFGDEVCFTASCTSLLSFSREATRCSFFFYELLWKMFFVVNGK